MFESEADIAALQELLDRSHGAQGAHMGTIVTEERRVNARQLVTYLQDVKHIAFGTVSSKGEPSVSPLDGLFVRGHFIAGTAGNAVKVKHLRRNPAVSICHLVGDDIGVWAHGRAEFVERGSADADMVESLWMRIHGVSLYSLGDDIVLIKVVPRAMFAFAMDPSKFPEA